MKIETRVEQSRRVWVETELQDRACTEEAGDGVWLKFEYHTALFARKEWEDFKALGDAAWEAWDKTFGDKQPETQGIWRSEEAGQTTQTGARRLSYLPAAFVWYPGEKDFKGSAQRALDALRAEKPEWKLELREYTKSEAPRMCATCQGCGGHLCGKSDHERCDGRTAACTRKSSISK
jgi:hypothetical protein